MTPLWSEQQQRWVPISECDGSGEPKRPTPPSVAVEEERVKGERVTPQTLRVVAAGNRA